MNKEEINNAIKTLARFDGTTDQELQRDAEIAVPILQRELNEHVQKSDNGWIPFRTEYDEDLKLGMLQCEIPDEEQEILVTDGISTWSDIFMQDEKGWYLDSGADLVTSVTAWQCLPEPYKGEEE